MVREECGIQLLEIRHCSFQSRIRVNMMFETQTQNHTHHRPWKSWHYHPALALVSGLRFAVVLQVVVVGSVVAGSALVAAAAVHGCVLCARKVRRHGRFCDFVVVDGLDAR